MKLQTVLALREQEIQLRLRMISKKVFSPDFWVQAADMSKGNN